MVEPVVYKSFDPIKYYIDYGSVFLYVVVPAQGGTNKTLARGAQLHVRKEFERGLKDRSIAEASWLDLLVVTGFGKEHISKVHQVCKARHEHFIEKKGTLDR